ncbi:MAG: motif putative anchor domain protein [Chthonomonadaceae bacterium]|nr:motif putative anchor domain protein [Chthonomonadaceae bacterium]
MTPAATVVGCGGGSSGSTGASKSAARLWTNQTHAAVVALKPYPPAAARAHAMVSTSMFDAWTAYDPVAVGTQLGATLRRPTAARTAANKQKAVSFAAYRTLLDLFPPQQPVLDAQMTALGYDPTDASVDVTTPAGIGNRAAAALLAYRHNDGSNQLGDLHPGAYSDYSGYVPLNAPDTNNPATNVVADPDHWQPLTVSNGTGGFVVQKYASACAGLVKPFALSSGGQFRTGVVLSKFGSPEYLAKCQVVIDASANLTDMQKLNTEYWGDGPGTVQPPGHWMVFADWLSGRDHNDLDEDVKLFFMVGNAVLDSGIACWDTKRTYNSVRPLTAIHVAFKGKTIRAWGGPGLGTISMLGESFGTFQSPTFVTPSFPSYNSGHSAFSGAAAEVLKRYTGSDNFSFTQTWSAGSSVLEPGLVPSSTLSVTWNTFTDAANAAAGSRLTGGIHFSEDIVDGLVMGRVVGSVVYAKAIKYIDGTV